MKKGIVVLLAGLLLSTLSFAQTLTKADRDHGVEYLQTTRDAIVSATKGLSEAQMKFKSAPDRWSVAEVLEHIALAEDYFYDSVVEKVMKAPAPAAGRDVAKTDAMVMAMIPDRSQKAQAPPPLVPTGRWSPSETLDHFLKARTKTIDYLKKTDDLRAHATTDSPLGQPLDAYEWIIFCAAHSERHTKQILEVKADANFPKK